MKLSVDIDPVNVDADGISVAATLSGGGAQNLTLGGALTSGGVYTAADGDSAPARQISITAAGNESARTFTVTGTDADGKAQTETITGPNATTTESTKYWLTVTQIQVDDDTAGDVSAGIVDELVSKTYQMGYRWEAPLVTVNVTGTINYTIQVTNQNVIDNIAQEDLFWIAAQDTDLVSATADAIGSLSRGITAFRILINSYSSGAEIQAYITQ